MEKNMQNKTIKFRAWIIEEKEMVYPEEIHFNTHTIFTQTSKGKTICKFHEIELMQSIGMGDRNGGSEIFEGDIVDCEVCGDEAHLPQYQRIVVTSNTQLGAKDKIKIIGNIYENPGLDPRN
jgi:hypothetical protein